MGKRYYSIEINKDDPTALTYCLRKLENAIPDYGYDWRIVINAGGIDYGIYLNIDIEDKEIEICNQPRYGNAGEDMVDDVIELFEEKEEDEYE